MSGKWRAQENPWKLPPLKTAVESGRVGAVSPNMLSILFYLVSALFLLAYLTFTDNNNFIKLKALFSLFNDCNMKLHKSK